MKTSILLFITLFFFSKGDSQNLGIGTSTPNSSAKVEISSTNKGFLPPRMSFAQRNAIPNPATGLVIWCSDCGEMQVYDGYLWKNMSGYAASGISFPAIIQTWNLCGYTD